MRQFILRQINIFDKYDFWVGRQWTEAVSVFSWWAGPAFVIVILANAYQPDSEFYQKAISEGIGPNLWNLLGSFGLFTFGLAVILPNHEWPSMVAEKILSNTYAMGCLTFGLLLGQWVLVLNTSSLIWWKTGLFGVTSGLLLVIVLFYNLVVWYLSFIIRNRHRMRSPLIIKLQQFGVLPRVAIGGGTCMLIVFLLASAK